MKWLKNLIPILAMLTLVSMQACSQSVKKTNQEMKQEIIENVKSYSEKPEYSLQVFSANCRWEILLNDVPVYKNFSEQEGFSGRLPLNFNILQTGKQDLQVKILPMAGETELGEFSTFKISLKWKRDISNGDDFVSLFNYELPADSIKSLPVFEYKHTFEATVPYTLTGWNNAKQLNEIQYIEKQLLRKMEEARKIVISQNTQKYNTFIINLLKDKCQAFYATPQKTEYELNDVFDVEKEYLENIKYLPIEDYEVVFYANGRLATLENKTDKNSVVRFTATYKEDKSPFTGYYDFIYFIPENGSELEVIR